jgi:hypothetical protein
MIKLTVKNVGVYEIPEGYDEMKFGTYLKLMSSNFTSEEVVSIVTGVNIEYLKKWNDINGYNEILKALSWLTVKNEIQPQGSITFKGVLYKFKDIGDLDVGMYEDFKKIALSLWKDYKLQLLQYPTLVSLYLSKVVNGVYDYDKALDMVEDVYSCSAQDVVGLVGFFFKKLNESLNGTGIISKIVQWTRRQHVQASMN